MIAKGTSIAYSDAEIEKIAAWLRDGLTATQIGELLSRVVGRAVSRNAVIGIVHRNEALKTIGFARAHAGKSGAGRKKASRGARRGVSRAPLPPTSNPAYLPARLFVQAVGNEEPPETLMLRTPVPQSHPVLDREPHRVAMRFVDCLPDPTHPNRCRWPLDLSLDGETGPDMPVCGIRIEPGETYCRWCRARSVSSGAFVALAA